jgi:hypothetical protein
MNHLVTLDMHTGELEKILSGVKYMLVKEFDPGQSAVQLVSPGDTLYFLRDKDDCRVRVKASVVRVQLVTKRLDEDLSHTLKEMQPKLQLTENQYNYWSAKKQALLVEFTGAQKMYMFNAAPRKITDRSGWVAFEDFNLIKE